MTASPLEAIPPPSRYPRTSRYHDIPSAVHTTPGGREIPYLTRRFLPPHQDLVDIAEHVVSEGDRPDLVANTHLGDPEAWWRIADANPVLDPRELTDTPGRRLRITLPPGVPGTGING